MVHPGPLFIFGSLGLQEILVVLLILLLLFGGRKIPELARGLGRGIREFKTGVQETPKKDPEALPRETQSNDAPPKDS
jgi:sec-independent protein translocase protein TatA